MAEVMATVIVEEGVRSCFEVIRHYVSCTRKYKSNIKSLEVELRKIEDTRDTVLREVQMAENNAEDIRKDVLGWQMKCEDLISKGYEFFKDKRSSHMSCGYCSCPNLKSRYLASSQAAKLTYFMNRHVEECKFDKVGHPPLLGQLSLLSPGEFHGFGSRMVIIKEIMSGLKNDSISVIGLTGMGGVGKTTLVKQIVEEVKNEDLFDEVAFVVVSQNENVKGIQDQLASRLGLKAIKKEMDNLGRSELLYKRLMDVNKRILVILDDIWQELNLRSVGIPVHGDRKGFKILLTSRSDVVCADMKVQQRLHVATLSPEEAWNLFKMTAEISDNTFKEIAKQVSQECAGLPLAIVTVGKSLRNKNEHAFRDVLRKLRDTSKRNTSRIHVVLHSCIKSSYDYLESDEHRSVLLLCSLFPEDYDVPVEDLVRYARGLFNNFELMAETRDRVEVIIDDLMNCYLILPGEQNKCVKLHDVVRDVCLSIASKSSDVPISLKFDDLRKMLSGLKSQRPQLLRLVNKEAFCKFGFYPWLRLDKTENIEMIFSKDMQDLRVLEVNHICTSLPSSLPFMINLHTLSLDYCRLHGDFAGIGSLKMLRVLSFFHTIVEIFPTEIIRLSNLQCLDLRFHLKHSTRLPAGTLSSLEELEELYMLGNVLGDIESLKEVCSLSKLHTIQFLVDRDDSYLEVLLKNLNLSDLNRFDIAQIQPGVEKIEYQIRENMLDLRGKNVHMDLCLLKALMWRVKSFTFNGDGLSNVVDVLGDDSGFPNLKYLKLVSCDMKYLVDATNHLARGIFSKLETLEIEDFGQLEELIHGEHPLVRRSIELHELNQGNMNVRCPFQCPLGNLRRVEIYECVKLRSLFSESMGKYLRNLDYLDLQSCPILERIITSQKDEEDDFSEFFQFPTLRHLSLDKLPRLRSLGLDSSQMAGFNQVMLPKLERLEVRLCDSIKEIGREADQQELCFSLGCSLPNVLYMDIRKCNNLLTIAKSGLVHGFQDLERLEVSDCFSLEVVFDFEEMMSLTSAEPLETTLLGRLEWLELDCLPKLKHVWRMLPKEIPVFRNLKELRVRQCGSLRYLLTPSMTNKLVYLEEIMLEDNELIEALIDMPNDGDESLPGRIVLPKLKSLTIKRLPSFRKLCSVEVLTLELPFLSELYIDRCPKMSEFCAGQMSAPKLQIVNYGWMGNEIALEYFINSWLKDCESMIRCLNCAYNGSETCRHLHHQNSD